MLSAVPTIGDGKLVFTHDGRPPVGGFSKFKARLEQASGTTKWTLHDLRRTARSLLSRARATAVALSAGLISAETALLHLHETGAVESQHHLGKRGDNDK